MAPVSTRLVQLLQPLPRPEGTLPYGTVIRMPIDLISKYAARGYIKPLPFDRDACQGCGETDFWKSRYGRIVCRVCHPPVPGAEA